jgi:hypothetical protein
MARGPEGGGMTPTRTQRAREAGGIAATSATLDNAGGAHAPGLESRLTRNPSIEGEEWRPVVYGTATAGYRGTATAGYRGTATAGDSGQLLIRWWDQVALRWRTVTGYVGEDGIKPKTPYRLDDEHHLVEVVKDGTP